MTSKMFRIPGRLGVILGIALSSLVSTGWTAESPSEVEVALTLHELRHDPAEPDAFFLRFRLLFQWDPASLPGWDPWTDLYFANAVGPVSRVRVVSEGHGSAGEPEIRPNGASETWLVEGAFKSYNDFREYPLDEHELGIVLLSRSLPEEALVFRSAKEWLNVRPTFQGRIEGWELLHLGFHDRADAFLHSVAATESGESPAFAGWEFLVERDRLVVFVQLLLPMLVLWLFSYLGFFWKGDSPASRFSTAAMFAAIALFLGVRAGAPQVGYLLDLHALFLALYLAIGVNALLVAIVFHFVHEGKQQKAANWRMGARIASPLFAAILIGLILLLGQVDTADAVFEGEAPILQVQ